MPDAHFGMGAAVGTVIPTKGAIIPAAVGVDIGCGMIAARTKYELSDLDFCPPLTELRDSIVHSIPMAKGNYNQSLDRFPFTRDRVNYLRRLADDGATLTQRVDLTHSPKWDVQLGTLGGGNHFIELCHDDTPKKNLWMFLHSGSRGVGNKIAQKHIKIAQRLMREFHIESYLPDPDLAYLPQSVPEFGEYIKELHWAQKFALANREEMMDRFAQSLRHFMSDEPDPGNVELQRINCHHNYTEMENHFGENVWVTRKGAIRAGRDDWGLIPGSMGTRSYVVQGKGNPQSFCSAPHGAGRVMSRNEAKKTFTKEDLDARMKAAGIVYRPGEEFVDEIPDAYKDIDMVMKDAEDLVEVKYTLKQLVNVKGA